jgi:cyclohexa-1,5-dienecarbonyl-CoA hydratase
MVLASDRATFGQPEIKVGVFPPVAAVIFPHIVGRNKTLELLLTGQTVAAVEAKAIGLINQVFPAQDFQRKSEEFIGSLAALSGSVLKMTKRAVDRGLNKNVSDGLSSAEELYLGELMQTQDANEGLRAYLEKRKPEWRNR